MSQTTGVGLVLCMGHPPAHESADYKKVLAALGSGVERDLRIAEGVQVFYRAVGSGWKIGMELPSES
jgi:hypothetical protein